MLDYQPLGQVAGGTEYHHGAGIGWFGLSPRRNCATGAVCGVRIRRSSMALLGGVLCRRATVRILWLWFGVGRLSTLEVPAEAEAHG